MAFEQKQGESIDFAEEFNSIPVRQPNKTIVVKLGWIKLKSKMERRRGIVRGKHDF